MTVCIAARCAHHNGGGVIFGACDRMMTAGDIKFEASTSNKLVMLTPSLVVMTAGDMALQDEIMREVYNVVKARVERDPTNWWRIKDVAELYVQIYLHAKSKRASNAILAPLGLTQESFLARQNELSENFVTQINSELINYQVQTVETIITGIDTDGGPHIYMVEDGFISCRDSIGFAAIGSGSRHAESQFMLQRHAWNSPVTDTLLLAYIAKKRAETAPGVGHETDMFMIPHLGGFDTLSAAAMEKLQAEYEQILEGERSIFNKSKLEMKTYVEKISEKPAITQGETSSSNPTEGTPSAGGATLQEPTT
jgi:hypothetical protein